MSERVYYSSEAEESARRRKRVQALAFGTLGAGVGAAAALLLAPHNGEKTRERVASAMGEGVKRGRDLTEDVWEQLNAEFPNVRARFEELASKAVNK